MICAEELQSYVSIIIFFVVGVILVSYIYRNPKEALKLLLIAAVAVLFIIGIAGAEDFEDTIGEVIIHKEIDGVLYTIEEVDSVLWIIPVETKFGVIRFYADNPNWEGKVYLLLFGEDLEVIDAFMVNDLEAPFWELSIFFIFMAPMGLEPCAKEVLYDKIQCRSGRLSLLRYGRRKT